MTASILYFSALFFLASLVNCASSIEKSPIIEISGNKFFNSSDKSQFFIKGVAYQRPYQPDKTSIGYIDSLALPTLCLKDLEYLKELGVNTVRVYQIDPAANHDVCMNAFAARNIYVIADLAEPKLSINRNSPSWNTDLLERYTAVVDSMHTYTNIIGFIAGNEVVDSIENTDSAAFVRAAIRDVKNHMRHKDYRQIPIGYASTDESITRLDSANYFVCSDEGTEDSIADFYAINMFEWCGYSSFHTSGYRERTIEFALMPVPIFFSEYGCNTVIPRPFTEIEQIYGPTMSQVWSGGIVYEFFQKENMFGLVQESPNGRIAKLADFNTVRLRLVENKPQGVRQTMSLSVRNFKVHCPPVSNTWRSLAILPPTPDEGKCECLQATLSCILTPYVKVNEHNLLNELCSLVDCSEIQSNATTGTYGKISECGLRQRISYALNKYWQENDRKPELCDFNKRAVLISNTRFADLDNIQAADGRTCRQALEGLMEAPGYEAEKVRKLSVKNSRSTMGRVEVSAKSNEAQKLAAAIFIPVVSIVVSLFYLIIY